MRHWVFALAVTLPMFGQGLDLKFLDKYADKTDEVVTVTLDENLLRLGAGFLGGTADKDAKEVKDVVSGLKSIIVRSFKFKQDNEVAPGDIESLTRQLQGWSQIVDVREGKGKRTGVWIKPNDKIMGGLVVLAVEPRELTVVSIAGSVDMEKLGKLGGNFGIPEIARHAAGQHTPRAAKEGKATPAPAPEPAKKDEQDEQ